MMSSTALIPARGGSRRIPRKNLKALLGIPAIGRVIAVLQQSGIFDEIVVSTEDDEIAEVARAAGAVLPGRRPVGLADDHATTVDVVRHAMSEWLRPSEFTDALWVVYPTAVLLTPRTLLAAKETFDASRMDFLVPVLRYAHPVERRMRRTAEGYLAADDPVALGIRSQDLQPAYHDAGQFYVGTFGAWATLSPLASGRNLGFEVPADEAIDIDEPEHWERAERLARMRETRPEENSPNPLPFARTQQPEEWE
jgi:pseudaminic acid cytidylyltransferase